MEARLININFYDQFKKFFKDVNSFLDDIKWNEENREKGLTEEQQYSYNKIIIDCNYLYENFKITYPNFETGNYIIMTDEMDTLFFSIAELIKKRSYERLEKYRVKRTTFTLKEMLILLKYHVMIIKKDEKNEYFK